ncbi:hypothetical protein ABT237_34570 [Streptomyces sp. NPDC001581]|uniref:hypothetical protein n=1 Tax=Streptomyces sp. NPDC001581 TaxID=3154386 RepID=UPI00331BCB2A
MSAGTAPEGPHVGIYELCEQVRGALAAWAPRILGVHVRRSVEGPVDVAWLVGVVADAAELTVLAADGATAREELHVAASRAWAAADELPGTDVRAELTAVRAGCRRAAVALGLPVPVSH